MSNATLMRRKPGHRRRRGRYRPGLLRRQADAGRGNRRLDRRLPERV